MAITNAQSHGGCNRVTITWNNDHNASTAALDDPNGIKLTPPPSTPLPTWGSQGNLHRGTYTYTIVNSGNVPHVTVPGSPDPSCTSYSNGLLIRSSNATSESIPDSRAFALPESEQTPEPADTLIFYNVPGVFVLLTPRRDMLNQYTHSVGRITQDLWQHVHTLNLPAGDAVQDTAISLIQNTPGKFEAVVRATPVRGGGDDFLVAYELQGTSDWQGPVNLIANDGPINRVTGAQAFIESDNGQHSQFELLVPRGALIYHYRRDTGTILDGTWKLVATLKPPEGNEQVQMIAVSLNQSPLGTLAAIARVTPPGGGHDFLVGYEFDETTGWTGPFNLVADNGPINGVTGSQALFQNDQDIFELLVPRGALIHHYIHEVGSIAHGVWQFVATLNPPDNNDLVQAISVSLTQNPSGNLELVARERPPAGQGDDFFVGYEFDPAVGWSPAVPLISNDGPILASDSQSGNQTSSSVIL
jgi:hypothetical protein